MASPPAPGFAALPRHINSLGLTCFIFFFFPFSTSPNFSFFIFNWRIIVLQCCVGFCCITVQISHKYICFPFFLSLPTPPGHHRAPGGLPVLYSSFPLAIYFTHGCVYMSILTPFKMVRLPLFWSICTKYSALHLKLCFYLTSNPQQITIIRASIF